MSRIRQNVDLGMGQERFQPFACLFAVDEGIFRSPKKKYRHVQVGNLVITEKLVNDPKMNAKLNA